MQDRFFSAIVFVTLLLFIVQPINIIRVLKKKKFKEFLEYNAFIRNFNRLIKFSLHCKTNSFYFLSIDEGRDISDEIKATLGEMTLPIVLSNFSPPSPLSMRIKLDCSFELFIKIHYIWEEKNAARVTARFD